MLHESKQLDKRLNLRNFLIFVASNNYKYSLEGDPIRLSHD